MSFNPKVVGFDPPVPDDPVAQAASQWVVAKDRGLGAAESQALLEWLAADPRHGVEYARILRAWRGLDGAASDGEIAGLADAVELRARLWRRRRRGWRMTAGLVAGAAAVAALGLLWPRARPAAPAPAELPEANYQILPSTARRVLLPDGSVAKLNGDSRVETDFTPAERRVQLVRGEALFIVAKNARRPFIVSAGPVRVRAVGTAFNVRLDPGFVEVLVTEGRVHVTSGRPPPMERVSSGAPGSEPAGRALVANERAIVKTAGVPEAAVTVDQPTPAELEEAMAWNSNRLVFDHTPLDQVVAAFNLYNTHKLLLADPSLRTRTLTGIFRTDNLAAFVRLLPASANVIAEAGPGGQTLLRPAP